MPKGVYDRSKTLGKAPQRMLMVKAGKKRNEIDLDKDTWYAVSEYAKGKTIRQICEEINANNSYSVTPEAIRVSIENAFVEWKKQNMENIDSYICGEIVRLEELESEIREEYERSRAIRPHEYAVLMKRGLSVGEIDEIFESHKGAGDPRFFDTLLKIQMQKLKLLGIDKGNDIAQQTNVIYNFGDLDDISLSRLADGLQDTKYEEIRDDK